MQALIGYCRITQVLAGRWSSERLGGQIGGRSLNGIDSRQG